MRGVEGFGAKHHLRTDRLLTLSEDLPARLGRGRHARRGSRPRSPRSTALRVRRAGHARARADARGDADGRAPRGARGDQAHRLRRPPASASRAPAYEAVVDLLHRRGVAGATVLLGVDGTAHGARRRARFFGRNAERAADGHRRRRRRADRRASCPSSARCSPARCSRSSASASASATASRSPRPRTCPRPTRPAWASGRS